jgi:ABC-type multidrug transport system ATPase subunit
MDRVTFLAGPPSRSLRESPGPEAIRLERVTVAYGPVVACDAVSLSVPPGTFYALLGRAGSGKSSLVRCILGERRPTAGTVLVLGEDPRRGRAWWRFRSRRSIASPASPEALEEALLRRPALLVIDGWSPSKNALERIAGEVTRGLAVFLAVSSAPEPASLVHRVGILVKGRLVVDEPVKDLPTRFRRIRYVNQITETRTEYGNELEEFDAVSVRARGWGVEAIVSNFTEEAFERFRRIDGVAEARAEPLSLAEIFENWR